MSHCVTRPTVKAAVGAFAVLVIAANQLLALEPIPDKLVVMTFDDSVKSHYTVARPILKKYRFGATFFITEGFTFKTNKKHYMAWEEIRTLHEDGFEIGNHTQNHKAMVGEDVADLAAELHGIANQCRRHGIPRPTSFAWPGNAFSVEALAGLKQQGIRFARRGGNPEFPQWGGKGYAYEPGRDHHLLIPSAAVPLPKWKMADLVEAVAKSRNGRIAVVQFHGVPEGEHPFVNTPRRLFEDFLLYLHDHKFKVIALGDLDNYVDTKKAPVDPQQIIRERTRASAD